MDAFALFCVISCFSATVSCLPTVSYDTCLPGSSFLSSDNCNTCTCPDNGVKSQAACTEKACINVTPQGHTHHSSESSDSSEEHRTARVLTDTCLPGSSFLHSDNCNTCTCPESGIKSQAGCTEKLCPNVTPQGHTHHSSESSESSEHRTARDTSQTCEPGTSFMDAQNCNRCFCPPSGLKSQAGCTLKYCFNTTLPVTTVHHSSESSADTSEHVAAKRDTSQTCEPGSSFMDSAKCNTCLCPPSGLKLQAACTLKSCYNTTLPVSTDTCLPGSSFLHSDNCNTCTCPDNGVKSQAACTEKLCPNVTPQGHTHHSSESSESSEHRTARDTSQTCEPGKSFMHSDNCNRCFCPPSGLKSQAGCTQTFCFNTTLPVTTAHHSSESSAESSENTAAKRDTSQTCEPGSSFMDSAKCNTCLCPPSGLKLQAACTLKACHNTTLPVTTVHHSSESSAESSEHVAAKRDTSQTCEPGTSFMDEENCNSCFCPPSGLKSQAGCTEKACINTTLPVSTDTCLPGSSFLHSDNCNTCTCPDNGVKSQAACTEKACINVTPQGHTHHSSESSESSEHRTTRDTSQTCEPGTSFMDAENCNSCFCPPSGLKSQAGCTMKLCYNTTLPVTTVHHSSESSADTSEQHVAAKRETSDESSEETCAEGDKWIAADGCNHCWCPNSRKKSEAACTRMACLPPHLIPSKDY